MYPVPWLGFDSRSRETLNYRPHKYHPVMGVAYKIGLNETANKFYFINNEISLDMLDLTFVLATFVNFKKLAKIMFLKYGKT